MPDDRAEDPEKWYIAADALKLYLDHNHAYYKKTREYYSCPCWFCKMVNMRIMYTKIKLQWD